MSKRGAGKLFLGLVLLLVVLVFILIAVNRTATFTPQRIQFQVMPPQISATGVITNQSLRITNSAGSRISVSFGHQTYSNASWYPPKEHLYRSPRFVLADVEGAPAGVGYQVPHPNTNHAWRFVILVQKYYGDTLLGEFENWYDRQLHPNSFSNADHRGAFDQFLYSEIFGVTNSVVRQKGFHDSSNHRPGPKISNPDSGE